MSILLRLTLATLLSLPAAWAQAQAYKCKQPNGSVSFQDQPCQSGAAGSKITLPATGGAAADAGNVPRPTAAHPAPGMPAHSADLKRQQDETNAYNQKVAAQNKAIRCDQARQQLGILKEPRPVFRRDNEGNRQYVDDKDRDAEIAAAQRRVNADCR